MQTVCKNFEEYEKAHERYHSYMEMVREEQMPYISRYGGNRNNNLIYEHYSSYLYEYDVTSLDELKKMFNKEKSSDKGLSSIIRAVIENYGRETKRGNLIGLSITEEDYYYIFDQNGTTTYDSCISKLEFI